MPEASSAVTVKLKALPAVALVGTVTAKRLGAAGTTEIVALVLILPAISVAVKD